MLSSTDNRKLSRENYTHVPKRWDGWLLVILWVMDACYHLGKYRIKRQVLISDILHWVDFDILLQIYFCYTVYRFLLLLGVLCLCNSFKNAMYK